MKHKYTLQWLSAVTGKAKLLIGLLVVLQAVLSANSIAFAFVFRQLINTAAAGDGVGFRSSLILMASLLLTQMLLGALCRFLNDHTYMCVENRLKKRMFSALLTGDYAAVTSVHSGEWMNRLVSDVGLVAGSATQLVPSLIGMLVSLLGAIAAILWLEPRFLYILIPGGLLILAASYALRKILKRMHKDIREADGRLRVFLQERLESMLILRSFVREKHTEAQAASLMHTHKAVRMRHSNFSNLCGLGFAGVMNGAYLLGIGYCSHGILMGTMSYGNLIAIMQLIGQVQGPFANLSGVLPQYYAMLASAERLLEAEAFDTDSENTHSEDAVLGFYRREFQELCLKNASFTYQPPVSGEEKRMPVVLQDIDLCIRKGEYVVFSGPSGCGKSTVLKLLMSLYPLDAGERLLVGESGSEPLTAAWRSLFAYVPQGNQLLSGTIREIIAFGDEEKAGDEDGIYRALQIACAKDFVKELEAGLDTNLGERGAGLSEGQMQRIAIARAVFSEHPILMLDEATSALDETTSRQVLDNLRRMTDKTVLMVTHRMDQTDIFDKELRFSGNGIEERPGLRTTKAEERSGLWRE